MEKLTQKEKEILENIRIAESALAEIRSCIFDDDVLFKLDNLGLDINAIKITTTGEPQT